MFPTLVYKDGGKHQCPGGTYSYCAANDEAEFTKLLKEGWRESLEQTTVKKVEVTEEAISDAPPTREEIEKMADELSIKYDKRMKDATIIKKIDKALAK